MVKLLAVGGILMEVAATFGSFGGSLGTENLFTWLALNAALLTVPVAYRVCELLVVAVTDAPQVMTLDVSESNPRRLR